MFKHWLISIRMTLNNFRTGSTSGIVISADREWTSLQCDVRKRRQSVKLLSYGKCDVETHGTCRQGDRCPIGMDVAIYCAHLGVVDRVHNKCVLVCSRVAWHEAGVRARRGSRQDYLACGACTPPRTAAGPQSEGEAGHREIRVARPLQPAAAARPPNKPRTADLWHSNIVSRVTSHPPPT